MSTHGTIESDEDFFCSIDGCAGFVLSDLGEFPASLFEDEDYGIDGDSGFVSTPPFLMHELGLITFEQYEENNSTEEILFCQVVYKEDDKPYYRVIWLHTHYE